VNVALLGRAAVPVDRGERIGGTPLPTLEHQAHHELRGGLPALGEREPVEVGGVVVAAIVGTPAVVETGPREGRAHRERERGQGEERERSA
jgi:hypothetical protein